MRYTILLAMSLCLGAPLALAKPGTVKLKDGRTINGDITETDQEVRVATKAGSIVFRRDDLTDVSYSNLKEQYQTRLAAMINPTPKGHFDLARWLFENKEYELARTELDKALLLDPNYADAVVLRQTVEQTMIWNRKGPATAAAVQRKSPATRPAERRMLSPDEVNLLRQAELRKGEVPRVRLEGDVRKRFMEQFKIDPKQYMALPDHAKAAEILARGTPEMRQQVKIVSEPAAITEYKRLQPLILNGCATAKCHGGPDSGAFFLINPVDNETATNTNFYILSEYAATLGNVQRRMIDRQQPRNSLLAEFGLPRDRAEYDHPDVPGWTPIFRGEQDPKYRQLMTWISAALVTLQPNYGIDYPIHGAGAPTTQPVNLWAPPPQTGPTPPSPRNNPNNPNPAQPGDSTNETLTDIRQRLRPIRGL
jgi:hypothetical protein